MERVQISLLDFVIGVCRLLLLVVVGWWVVETILLIRDLRHSLSATAPALQHSAAHLQATTARLDQFLTEERLRDLENSLHTTAYTSQSVANDYGTVARATVRLLDRTAERLPQSLDRVDRVLERVEAQTLPEIAEVLDRTAGSSEQAAASARATLEALTELLRSPELAEALREVRGGAAEIRLSAAEVRAALPALLAELQRLTTASAGSAEEVQKFLQVLNQPQSRKHKIWRAIVQAIAYGLPIYLRR